MKINAPSAEVQKFVENRIKNEVAPTRGHRAESVFTFDWQQASWSTNRLSVPFRKTTMTALLAGLAEASRVATFDRVSGNLLEMRSI